MRPSAPAPSRNGVSHGTWRVGRPVAQGGGVRDRPPPCAADAAMRNCCHYARLTRDLWLLRRTPRRRRMCRHTMGRTTSPGLHGWAKDPKAIVRTSVARRPPPEAHAKPQLDLSSTAKTQHTIKLLGAVAVAGPPALTRPKGAKPKSRPKPKAGGKAGIPGKHAGSSSKPKK